MTTLKEEWKTLDKWSHRVQKKNRSQNSRAYTVKYNSPSDLLCYFLLLKSATACTVWKCEVENCRSEPLMLYIRCHSNQHGKISSPPPPPLPHSCLLSRVTWEPSQRQTAFLCVCVDILTVCGFRNLPGGCPLRLRGILQLWEVLLTLGAVGRGEWQETG